MSARRMPWDASDDSGEDDILLALTVCKRIKKWVHEVNRKRNEFGEFHHLMKQLRADEAKFIEYFRIKTTQFDSILLLMKNKIEKKNLNYRKSIGAEERLAVCLRYLATGNSFRSMAFSFRMGRSTVSDIISEVCAALWETLQPIVMPEPNEQIWRASAAVFRERWNFPHCVAAIDGKHVRVKAPAMTGSQFFNYKKFYFIVLLALVDGNYRFLTVDIGQYGRFSDANVFANSSIGIRLSSNTIGLPPDENILGNPLPYVIVGDEAFPLKRYLMRPLPRSGRGLSDTAKVFNYRLSRARNTVENSFGILANTWRVYHSPLECSTELAVAIIKATIVLHNYLRQKNIATNSHCEPYDEHTQLVWDLVQLNATSATNSTKEALSVRNLFMEYFGTDEGRVHWQDNAVNRAA